MAELQLAKWDGNKTIQTHRNTMVDIRTELAETGMIINDQSFYEYFTNSLPPSLDLFITLCDDSTYDIDLLCDKSSKNEMRHKLAAAKEGKADATSDVSLAMFGQASSPKKNEKKEKKEKKERDQKHITCFNCGKKGHIQARCTDGKKKDEKKVDKSGETRDEKSKSEQLGERESGRGTKPASGTSYNAISQSVLLATGDSTETFYVDSGASDHLTPSRGELCAYREFAKPVETSAAESGEIYYAYGSGTLCVATSANGLVGAPSCFSCFRLYGSRSAMT
jgi:Zinc knuckle